MVATALYGASIAQAAADDETVTVGTSFTRQPSEVLCLASGGCVVDFTFQLLDPNCGKTAAERLRQQRDLQPDLTVRENSSFTGCFVNSWPNFNAAFNSRHHQDGRVTSGTAQIRFRFLD